MTSETADWLAGARKTLTAKAKPPGSLGRLEDLAASLCAIQKTLAPATRPACFTLFVADHGVANAGVTLWPQAVSAAVASATLKGVSACAVLAKSVGAAVEVVDVGLSGPRLPPHAGFVDARVRDGSSDLSAEPALNAAEFAAAWQVGEDAARRALAEGARVLVAGEAGIGNTTAAGCIAALLCGLDPAATIGEGAGATSESLERKRAAAQRALARAQALGDEKAAIASVCGLEIAAMAGFYAEGARKGAVIVLDGAVCGAAALILERLAPGTKHAMIAATLSPEPSHIASLSRLSLAPYLDWSLRLGEGTGALLLLPMLDAAAAIMRDMADLKSLSE
jgi:nicotinate-nucleotide--dimethylbenzimidazole phosphoribosyltransferase